MQALRTSEPPRPVLQRVTGRSRQSRRQRRPTVGPQCAVFEDELTEGVLTPIYSRYGCATDSPRELVSV